MGLVEFDGILKFIGGGKPTPEERRELFKEAALMALARATSVDANIKKIEVERDYRIYSAFHDYGSFPATDYAGHRNLPEAYWVYVYPHWYLWERVQSEE